MSDLWLFVGGVFNGQTRELGLPPTGSRRIVLPIMDRSLSAFTVDQTTYPAAAMARTAEYVAVPLQWVDRYFPNWVDVQGRRLHGLMIGPKVQRMMLRVNMAGQPHYPSSALWDEMRVRTEHGALMRLRDSHMVNRQVSPVGREEEPDELWGGTVIRYEWLAEVEVQTYGVTTKSLDGIGLSSSQTLPERMQRLADAAFPEGVPPDLQEILDRANRRAESKGDNDARG